MVRVRGLACAAVLACAALVLASRPAPAGDKKSDKDKPALAGVWTQTGGETKIEFADKDVMKIFPHGDNDVIVVVCSYTTGKDGLVKAKITELDGKAKEKAKDLLPVGLEFRFKWQAKDAKATLDDVTGDKVPEQLKSHLEGKYDKK
jgi:hypothetical protein